MKSIIFLGDGMSDHPVAALGGKTPLMVAATPHMDRIAARGRCGLFRTVPPGLSNGSAVANLSVLGYDPAVCFKGRGVLEAASMGVELGPRDVAFRCNLLTIDDQGRLVNHSAGHIGTDDAGVLLDAVAAGLADFADTPMTFHRGVSYRHLLVARGGWASDLLDCAPPHDHVGEDARTVYPKARAPQAERTAAVLAAAMDRARAILESHPINRDRAARGKPVANSIWPWSPGTPPVMDTLQARFGRTGAVISAVDLVQGIGVLAGMEKIVVPGATGLHDTNFEGKADAALAALERVDVVYVHVEAPDEAGHERNLDLKIRCIEYLDRRLIGRVLEGLERREADVILSVLPDHPTPVETGKHASDPVPVAVWDPRFPADAVTCYDEDAVRSGALGLLEKDAFFRVAIGETA